MNYDEEDYCWLGGSVLYSSKNTESPYEQLDEKSVNIESSYSGLDEKSVNIESPDEKNGILYLKIGGGVEMPVENLIDDFFIVGGNAVNVEQELLKFLGNII